jgi:hypothetical protein
MPKSLAAAIVVTVIWAALDRMCATAFGWQPTNLFTTFFAALAGALMIVTYNAYSKS